MKISDFLIVRSAGIFGVTGDDISCSCHGNQTESETSFMENNDIHIRVASEDDAEEILAIYAPYVIKTAITFE